MKSLIALAVLSMTVNTFAASFVGTTLLPTESLAVISLATSGQNINKEAAQIINDSQEFYQSGVISAFLSEKIASVQAQDALVSTQDALDALVSVSKEVLK